MDVECVIQAARTLEAGMAGIEWELRVQRRFAQTAEVCDVLDTLASMADAISRFAEAVHSAVDSTVTTSPE